MLDIEKIRREKSISELLKFSIINLDKPSGPTSFQVSHFVKNLLDLNKTSHGGTLDPGVSGVLPIMLSRACRLSEYLMHRNKTYVGIMRLHSNISEAQLKSTIKKFIGKIMQMPPLRSRVKREIREREVISFDTLETSGKDVLFKTEVQAGTYIRTLCDSIGKEIGGAHMLELRRTKAGIFEEKDSITLYELEDAFNKFKSGDGSSLRKFLIPGEIIANILPLIQIKEEFLKKLLSGSPVFPAFLEKNEIIKKLNKDDKFCLFCKDEFIGCYNFTGEKELLARPEFVFN